MSLIRIVIVKIRGALLGLTRYNPNDCSQLCSNLRLILIHDAAL
jgi:hypothetical protein